MLLYLTQYLAQFESGFNVFDYLTMRAILGALTALVLSFVIGPRMIRKLSRNQLGQPIRDDGPDTHLIKAGTPTMGGALILTSISVSTLLWSDLENMFVWVVLFVTLAFGVIGYVDDYKKTRHAEPRWNFGQAKSMFWQSLVAIIAAVALYHYAELNGTLETANGAAHSVLQRLDHSAWHVADGGHVPVYRRFQQCGKPDGRPGWSRDHADSARRRRTRPVCLRYG